MNAPIKQILVSNGRRHVPLGGYASPSAKTWLYKDLDFWPSGRRPLCIGDLVFMGGTRKVLPRWLSSRLMEHPNGY